MNTTEIVERLQAHQRETLIRVFVVAEVIARDDYFDSAEPAIRRLRELVAEGQKIRDELRELLAGRAA